MIVRTGYHDIAWVADHPKAGMFGIKQALREPAVIVQIETGFWIDWVGAQMAAMELRLQDFGQIQEHALHPDGAGFVIRTDEKNISRFCSLPRPTHELTYAPIKSGDATRPRPRPNAPDGSDAVHALVRLAKLEQS